MIINPNIWRKVVVPVKSLMVNTKKQKEIKNCNLCIKCIFVNYDLNVSLYNVNILNL